MPGSTFDTNSVYFGNLVGNGTKGRHGAEGNSLEIHVEPCDDDPNATIGQLIAYINQSHVKELGFVNAYHIDVA